MTTVGFSSAVMNHYKSDKKGSTMRRFYLLLAAIALGLTTLPSATHAQSQRCFDVPGITNCIEGRFREYWEQNGGLAVFGYPISAATQQTTAEGTFLTQIFERNSFELHPEQARPYDVLLGRLGDVRLQQLGRPWANLPKGQQTAGCIWFAETGHSVCEPFRSYWEGQGLQDPSLNAYGKSLALFGLPLSEPAMETNAAGANVLTQWFERGRFEFHPNNTPEFRILLGLLGRETTSGSTPTPPTNPAPQPPVNPNPTRNCDNIPAPTNATINPNCVLFGFTLSVSSYGWEAGQAVSYRITDQNGVAAGPTETTNAGSGGSVGGTINTADWLGVQLRPGDYRFVVSDVRNVGEKRPDSVAPFRVIP